MKLLIEKPRRGLAVLGKWLLRAGVCLLFLFVGAGKFASHSPFVEIFEQIGFGDWFRYFTGILQMGGAALVLIPRTFAVGILMLACTMAGAMISWMTILGEPFNALIPGGLLFGLLFIGGEELIDLVSAQPRER
jgi:uncharacterized membrane protein YphA (DoxX/SURF4 family)